jgi:predicted nucleic acid-binding protein
MAKEVVHLDTSFLIRALKPDSSESVLMTRLLKDHIQLGISVVAWTVFLCGPLDNSQRELSGQLLGAAEPLLAEDSVLAASFFNQIGRRRGTLLDCMIAATAVRIGASLATSNPEDFRRFPGLELATF